MAKGKEGTGGGREELDKAEMGGESSGRQGRWKEETEEVRKEEWRDKNEKG